MLHKTLLELFNFISKLNGKDGNRIISEADAQEERENLNDLQVLLGTFSTLVSSLKDMNLEDKKLLDEKLLFIHLNLKDLYWHIDEMHELVVDIIRNID